MDIKSLFVWSVVLLVAVVLAQDEQQHEDDEFLSNFLHNDDHIHNKE